MDYSTIEDETNKIITFAEKFPEKYHLKIFETLFSQLNQKRFPEKQKEQDRGVAISKSTATIPPEIKALLMKHGIGMDRIDKIFYGEDSKFVPIYDLKTAKKSIGQRQLSLLLALENSLNNSDGKLEFSVEQVRNMCKERKYYDADHFNANLKKSKLCYNDLTDPEHISLSIQGKAELAKTIIGLSN